ncbi:hypothetical protein PINS_up009211 [Pythium insidiosum]|nr:hypothetical protein PINS_up009211 [Pythium insidiosum]
MAARKKLWVIAMMVMALVAWAGATTLPREASPQQLDNEEFFDIPAMVMVPPIPVSTKSAHDNAKEASIAEADERVFAPPCFPGSRFWPRCRWCRPGTPYWPRCRDMF